MRIKRFVIVAAVSLGLEGLLAVTWKAIHPQWITFQGHAPLVMVHHVSRQSRRHDAGFGRMGRPDDKTLGRCHPPGAGLVPGKTCGIQSRWRDFGYDYGRTYCPSG